MTYEYTLSWTDESSTIAGIEDDPVSLVAFPAVLAAEVAVAMMAMRLTVMFHPSMRATWGRYTKEERLLRGLACAYVLMEIVLWSAAAAQGVRRYVSYERVCKYDKDRVTPCTQSLTSLLPEYYKNCCGELNSLMMCPSSSRGVRDKPCDHSVGHFSEAELHGEKKSMYATRYSDCNIFEVLFLRFHSFTRTTCACILFSRNRR